MYYCDVTYWLVISQFGGHFGRHQLVFFPTAVYQEDGAGEKQEVDETENSETYTCNPTAPGTERRSRGQCQLPLFGSNNTIAYMCTDG